MSKAYKLIWIALFIVSTCAAIFLLISMFFPHHDSEDRWILLGLGLGALIVSFYIWIIPLSLIRKQEKSGIRNKVRIRSLLKPNITREPRLDQYTICEKIGIGGSSDVYRAERKDGLIVAMKIPRLDPESTSEYNFILKEAELWSKLNHSSIAKIYEYGATPYPWIAIEYMEGGSLRKLIGKLSLEKSIGISIQIADALFYASHLGIIHRDLKPENILFDNNNIPKIVDWGLGKRLLDMTGNMSTSKGTVLYSAPEQLSPSRFGNADWRTDIFQFGIVLYEMIAGKHPFSEYKFEDIYDDITNKEIPAPSQQNPQIPIELDRIIIKATAKRKEDRYQDFSALIDDLKDITGNIC